MMDEKKSVGAKARQPSYRTEPYPTTGSQITAVATPSAYIRAGEKVMIENRDKLRVSQSRK
jgi:hypothetical protein